jgi:DNA-directed RNA polymerase subunit RPC12/RpoP
MKCPSCGKDIDESRFSKDLTYCPHCGQDLKAAGVTGRLLFCPYCGQELSAQTNFCPNCGKKLLLDEKSTDQPRVKTFIERTAKPIAKSIRNTFGRERKVRKLYKQWAEFSNLPPEEIPSMDDLREMSAEKKTQKGGSPSDS